MTINELLLTTLNNLVSGSLARQGKEHFSAEVIQHPSDHNETEIRLELHNGLFKGTMSFYAKDEDGKIVAYSAEKNKRFNLSSICYTRFNLNHRDDLHSVAYHLLDGAQGQLNNNPTPIKARINPLKLSLRP